MKRLINVRYPLCFCIGLILGIYASFETYFGNIWLVICFAVVLTALFIVCLATKSSLYKAVLCAAIALTVGFACMQLAIVDQNGNAAVSQEVVITGRVCDVKRNGKKYNAVYLEDCTDNGGVKLRGRIRYVVFDGDKYQTGDVLTLRGTLDSVYPVKADVNTFYVKNNVRYDITDVTELDSMLGQVKLDEKIRRYIYDTTKTYMQDNGDVAYALLTGDRNALDENKADAFSAAGIAHLLAVSGLHVGFLVAICTFLLKRFKLPVWAELAILLVPLLFYAYICAFSPSVMRAVIMLACAYVVRAVFGSYDMLTSMSVAAIIILLISPLYLFDLGFQLSFLSVFGIATLYLQINRALKRKVKNRFVVGALSSLSLSFSCSVATFFAVAVSYGKAATLGVLVNVVAIPLVTVTFSLSIFGMLPWVFHYALWLADKILQAVVIVAEWVAGLQFAVVVVPVMGLAVVATIAFLFVIGGYVNLQKVGKTVAYSLCACIMAASVVLSVVPKNCGEQVYVSYGFEDVTMAATSSDNEMAIIGNVGDVSFSSVLDDFCAKRKRAKLYLYVPNFSECDAEAFANFLDGYKVDAVYLLDFSGNDKAQTEIDKRGVKLYRQLPNTQNGGKVKVLSVYDGALCGVVAEVNGMKAATFFSEELQTANALKIHSDLDFAALGFESDAVSSLQIPAGVPKHNALPNYYGANKYGNFTITQKDGTISISFR